MRVLMCSVVAMMVVAVGPLSAGNTALPQAAGRKDDGKLVKVTGCLTGGPSKFTLTNAAVSESPETKDEQTSRSAAVVSSYELTPRDGVSLAPHVGHRVELTGVVGEVKRDESGGLPPRGRRGLTADLAVTALRMISPICLE